METKEERKNHSALVDKLTTDMLKAIQAQEDYIKTMDNLTEEQDITLRSHTNNLAMILMRFDRAIST
jgi:predicted transcriptional regulator